MHRYGLQGSPRLAGIPNLEIQGVERRSPRPGAQSSGAQLRRLHGRRLALRNKERSGVKIKGRACLRSTLRGEWVGWGELSGGWVVVDDG